MARADLQAVGRHLHAMGANVTAVGSDGKKTLHSWRQWQDKRQTVDDVDGLPWQGAAAVGVLVGVGAWRIVDIDAQDGQTVGRDVLADVLTRLQLPGNYPWVWRSTSGSGWQLAVVCYDRLPDLVPLHTKVINFDVADHPTVVCIELRYQQVQSTLWPERMPAGVPDTPPAEVPMMAIWSALSAYGQPREARPSTVATNGREAVRLPQTAGGYDFAALNGQLDLLQLVPDLVKRNGQHEGPCPFCRRGEDRFIVKDGRFYNRGGAGADACTCGSNDGYWHDAIDFVTFADGRPLPDVLQELAAPAVAAGSLQPAAVDGQTADSGAPGALVPTVAPLRPVPVADFLQQEFAPLEFIIDGLLAKGHLAIFGGRPKSGKSWLVLGIAQCADLGLPFLGKPVAACRVCYIALEDGQRRVHGRIRALHWQPRQAAVLFNVAHFDGPGGQPGPGLQQVRQLAESYDLVIIDTLIATLSGRADENNNTQMAAIVNELASIAHDTDTAVLLIHHTGKMQSDDPFMTLRGASAIRGAYDVGLLLARKPDEREAILYAESRDVDVENMTLRQADNGAGWEYLGNATEIERIRAGRQTLQAMLDHAEHLDGLTVDQIAQARKVARQGVHRQLLALETAGYVYRQEQPSTLAGKQPDLWFVSDDVKE